MRKFAFIMLACLFGVSCLAQNRADSIRARILDRNDRSVLVASHRGVWTDVPENSVAAIEASIAAGADIVEIDVRRTAGGELILSHERVFRKPEGATSLEEALLAAKGRIMVNIDKAFLLFDDIVKVAERTGTLDQLIFKSGVSAAKARQVMGDYAGRVIFMPIIGICSPGALACISEYMKQLDPPMYELVFSNDKDPVLTIASALLAPGSRIWVNTMWASLCGGHDDALSLQDPEAGYGWLISSVGASALQTDRTAYLLDYLKNR